MKKTNSIKTPTPLLSISSQNVSVLSLKCCSLDNLKIHAIIWNHCCKCIVSKNNITYESK